VCLAGSDRSYADLAVALISALHEAGAQRIILAGKPSAELADLIDDYVAVGSDLVSFLQRTRQALESPVAVAGSERR
jgi:methylmalonyl-CoA mutase